MTKARRFACFYVALLMLGCTYCGGGGKDATPAPLPVVAQANLHTSNCEACGDQDFCNSLGVCVPNTWFCGPMYYNGGPDDGCDCNCGAPDPDCQRAGAQAWCYAAGQTHAVDQCSDCGGEAVPDPED